MPEWKVSFYGRTQAHRPIHRFMYTWVEATNRKAAVEQARYDYDAEPTEGVIEITRMTAKRTYRELWPGEFARMGL